MKLATPFSEHAVLQRDRSVPVWGRTLPNQRIRVALGPYRAEYVSNDDGRFVVRLPPMSAGGPYELTVETSDPAERVRVQDVLIGEVWLCSGQSNMAMTCAAIRADTIGLDLPAVRMLTVPRRPQSAPVEDVDAKWECCGPDTVADWSAVATYFGQRLHQELGVPIGLLNSSVGGTRIETWLSREALVGLKGADDEVARYEATVHSPDYWLTIPPHGVCPPPSPYPLDPGNEGEPKGWAAPDFDATEWGDMNLPKTWQAAGIAGSGAVWFRRTLDIPPDWSGRNLLLHIGAVDKHDVTYFNGERVGASGEGLDMGVWNVPRTYRVPARLVRSGRVVIAVRAYSFVYDGGLIGPARHMRLEIEGDTGARQSLAGPWRYCVEHALGVVTPVAPPPGPENPNSPHLLFDSMIAPLVPCALRGVIWYQGESNTECAEVYRERLVALIRDWRRAWGQGAFPLLIVQLANFRTPEPYHADSTWARLREAQVQALAEPHTGLAVAIDLGDEVDIHPVRKREVGDRLAQWALARTYGQAIVPSGPLFAGMATERDRIRIRFDHIGGGLVATGGPLCGFFLADASRTFHAAEAEIDGDTVVVRHPAVTEPSAVRYAWADNPAGCNLYNAEGLPASPFRTDAW